MEIKFTFKTPDVVENTLQHENLNEEEQQRAL